MSQHDCAWPHTGSSALQTCHPKGSCDSASDTMKLPLDPQTAILNSEAPIQTDGYSQQIYWHLKQTHPQRTGWQPLCQ